VVKQRRLAGILIGDVVGFSAAVGRDEVGTLAQLFEIRSQVIEPAIAGAVRRLQALGPIDMAWVRRELTPLSDPAAWDTYLGALQRAGVPA
jgi:hypothetical protein